MRHLEQMCRGVLVLYEMLEGEADACIRWPGAGATQDAHSRVDESAALQALVQRQEWHKATKCADTSAL